MLYTSPDKFPKIAYRKYGAGPVVVLLHGFPADGALWDRVYPLLSSFTVIVPDFPGTGESAGIGEGLSIDVLADFVYAILVHEQIKTAVIAGHSMGGYVAATFAEKYPAMLSGMAMIHSTAGPDDEAKKITRKKVIDVIRKGGREAFIKQMVPNLFSAGYQLEYPGEIELQTQKSLVLSSEAIIEFYIAMMDRPGKLNVLEHAAFPVQWILGKDDTVLPPGSVIKQSSVSNINFVNLYENCGHLSMIEQPARLANDLECFAEYCYRSKFIK